MCADAALEVHERGDAGTARPFDPPVERALAFFAFDCEHVTQSFFEEIRTPQSWGGLRDPVELVALAAGEVTRVLPKRVAGLRDVLGVARRAVRSATDLAGVTAAFGFDPCSPSFDVQRVDRP